MFLDAYFAWTLINLRPGRGGPGRLFRLDAYQLRGLLAGSWTLTLWSLDDNFRFQCGFELFGADCFLKKTVRENSQRKQF